MTIVTIEFSNTEKFKNKIYSFESSKAAYLFTEALELEWTATGGKQVHKDKDRATFELSENQYGRYFID